MSRRLRNLLGATRLVLTLRCEHSTRLVSESLERELSFSERWAVRLHAIGCHSCRRVGRQLRRLHEAAKHVAEAEARDLAAAEGPTLSPEGRRRIAAALRHARRGDADPEKDQNNADRL